LGGIFFKLIAPVWSRAFKLLTEGPLIVRKNCSHFADPSGIFI
jgi:hypothetical protein